MNHKRNMILYIFDVISIKPINLFLQNILAMNFRKIIKVKHFNTIFETFIMIKYYLLL